MARIASEDRRRQIGDAALKAFSESGFRLTQVADIARYAGTALGTLYLYAPSKEALFVMALERALGQEPQDVAAGQSEMIPLIKDHLTSVLAFPLLVSAGDDSGKSLPQPEAIFAEIWDSIEKFAPTIKLVERCAQDWPDLASLFYDTLRPNLLRLLTAYFERGADEDVLRRTPNSQIAARLVVETIAWFTMHRLGDHDGRYFDPSTVRAVTLDALVHAYAK